MNEARELMKEAKQQGITYKMIAKLCNISVSTLYKFVGGRNMCVEKQEKVYNTLRFMLSNLKC